MRREFPVVDVVFYKLSSRIDSIKVMMIITAMLHFSLWQQRLGLFCYDPLAQAALKALWIPARCRVTRTWTCSAPTTHISACVRQNQRPTRSDSTTKHEASGTYVEQERHRHARRRQKRKHAARPRVAQVRVHRRADEREDGCDDGPGDDRGRDSARAVDRVGIHEVLHQALHDDGAGEPERDSGEDGDYPVDRGVARPADVSDAQLDWSAGRLTRQTKTG